jgi:hypothetical protein
MLPGVVGEMYVGSKGEVKSEPMSAHMIIHRKRRAIKQLTVQLNMHALVIAYTDVNNQESCVDINCFIYRTWVNTRHFLINYHL